MKSFIQQMLSLLAPKKRELMRIAGILAVFEAVKILPPYFTKLVVDGLSTVIESPMHTVLLFAAGVAAAKTAVAAVDFFADRKIWPFLYWVDRYLPSMVQKKLLELSLRYHEDEHTGEKVVRLERGGERLVEFLEHSLFRMFPLALQIVMTVVALSVIDWQIALLFVLAIPPFALLTWRMHKTLHPIREEQEDLYEECSGRLAESIMHIKTVKAFVQEEREHRMYGKLRERIDELGVSQLGYFTRMNFWREDVLIWGHWLMMAAVVYKVFHGALSVGSAVFFFTLFGTAYSSLASLSQILDRMVRASEPLQRLFTLLQTQTDVPEPEHSKVPKVWRGKVVFEDVSFGYVREQKAIDGVSLTVRAGETVAFAGPSGGGKSTLVKLLLRFVDPQGGRILVDGVDLREMHLPAFRAHTGYVPQEVEIMSGTVRDNIRYGRPQASEAEILRAARLARVDEFVRRLPQGYDTLVGERGMRLSGGQRQRVGIARALLMQPSILIFDEATSSLDAESERHIQEALAEASKSSTTIIIAHRLSTIMHADTIVVVENGRIAEVGDHATLMRGNGLYERLVRLQTEEHRHEVAAV